VPVAAFRSTSSERTPCCARRMEAVRPTGPPPTMRTGTSITVVSLYYRVGD
jgi:hypothetical protein